jgi:hypothetical protein
MTDIKTFRIGTGTVDELTTDAIEKSVQTLFEKKLEALLSVCVSWQASLRQRMADASIRWGSMRMVVLFAGAAPRLLEGVVEHD